MTYTQRAEKTDAGLAGTNHELDTPKQQNKKTPAKKENKYDFITRLIAEDRAEMLKSPCEATAEKIERLIIMQKKCGRDETI